MEQEEKLRDEVETVEEFTYVGELLHGSRFPLKLKAAVYRSYVRPAILYGSEAGT